MLQRYEKNQNIVKKSNDNKSGLAVSEAYPD